LLPSNYDNLFLFLPGFSANAISQPTQGDFALALVKKLGHENVTDPGQAVKILSGLSIQPGIGPDAKWDPDSQADDKTVALVQASVQQLLKETSMELDIPPPPTLDLRILELPLLLSRCFFPPESNSNNSSESKSIDSIRPPPMMPNLPPGVDGLHEGQNK